MQIEAIREVSGLAAIRDEWEKLWQSLPIASPYTKWVWQFSWIVTHHLERRMFILLARDDHGTLAGIAPLQKVPLALPGYSALSFIGQETSLSPDFIVQGGREREFCEAVLQYVAGRRNIAGVLLKMSEPLFGAAPFLEQAFSDRFGQAKIERYSERSILQLPKSYEGFLQTLSSRMRKEIIVARKKLAESRSIFFCHNGGVKDIMTRLNDLFALNDLRWGQSGGRRVYESLYSRLNTAGILKVFILYVDGRPAAGLGALLAKETLYAELAGFDYDLDARHLGKCFYSLVIEWAICNGYRHFDFSSGNEEYKLRFNPQVYPKYRVLITSSTMGRFLLGKSQAIGKHIGWLREPAIV